jgi:hypothetical protein
VAADSFGYNSTEWYPDFQLAPKGDWKPSGLQCGVKRSHRFWAKTGAPPLILQWINKGVQLPLHSSPDPFHHTNPEWSPQEVQYWTQELLPKMLREGAIRPVEKPTNWVSASRLEPKSSGGYRHLVDLRPLNKHLAVPKCKFETLDLLPFLSR